MIAYTIKSKREKLLKPHTPQHTHLQAYIKISLHKQTDWEIEVQMFTPGVYSAEIPLDKGITVTVHYLVFSNET